jgi:hypothetical protein
MKTHLILGNSDDYHAVAVRWALRRMGESVFIWDGIGESPEGQVTIESNAGLNGVRLGQRFYRAFASLWYRRPLPFRDFKDVRSESVGFLERELLDSHVSMCTIIESISDFIVCGGDRRRSSSKAWQLEVARRTGFKTPSTIISNEYESIRSFINKHDRVIVKHFSPHYWGSNESDGLKAVGTNLLKSLNDVDKRSIELCPCIFQEYIEKSYEIRVTVIGDVVFAAKIQSEAGGSFVDWRFNFGEAGFTICPINLSGGMISQIFGLMGVLGIRYGCFDLIVDRNGDVYFLEVNTSGQFLFVEDAIPEFEMLKYFSAMLLARSHKFSVDYGSDISVGNFEQSDDFMEWSSGDRVSKGRKSCLTMVD